MKIKKILMTLTLLLSINVLSAQEIKNKLEEGKNLNKFFKQTPLQMSTYSIKYFFKSGYSTLYDLTQYRSIKNTKTALFNQSMSEYIRTILNLDEYPEHISQNGTPIIEFLELCNELNIDTERIYSGLRIFYNKLKGCELIDDTVVNQLLSKLPNLLSPYFSTTENKTSPFISLTYNIERLLYSKFTQNIDLFQETPNLFLTDLSNDISSLTQNTFNKIEENKNENEIKERLRQTTIKIFELLINKTIWNYQQYEGLWSSVLSIANGCENLAAYQIITHIDDLDELLWSLVERFCFFLDFAGAALPVSFYEIIESDLESKIIFFLEEPELDEGIKTKKNRLLQSLAAAKAKAIAAEKGILADSTIM